MESASSMFSFFQKIACLFKNTITSKTMIEEAMTWLEYLRTHGPPNPPCHSLQPRRAKDQNNRRWRRWGGLKQKISPMYGGCCVWDRTHENYYNADHMRKARQDFKSTDTMSLRRVSKSIRFLAFNAVPHLPTTSEHLSKKTQVSYTHGNHKNAREERMSSSAP